MPSILLPSLRFETLKFAALTMVFVLELFCSHNSFADEQFDYDPAGPMIFRRVATLGNCNGCVWILAEGTIQPDTPDVFRRFLISKKTYAQDDIRFNSPGGSLLAALKLGEMIRAAGFHTSVGKSVGKQASFDPETIIGDWTESKASCASACVYAFLGGVRRSAGKEQIGIHQFYDGRNIDEPLTKNASSVDRSIDQLLSGLLLEYVIRMGIDPKLVTLASTVPPWEDMRWLTTEELRDLRIDNSETAFTPLTIEPFGATGAYVETISRSVFYSFHHRIYCKGKAGTPHLAFISNSKIDDVERVKNLIDYIASNSRVVLIGNNVSRKFPIRLAALEAVGSGSKGVQASMEVVGATMADIQASKRVELDSDALDRHSGDLAIWLSFDLNGDRRKIGIAARSCIQ
jgi:hypothetical protein